MARKRKRFTGELAKPIKLKAIPILANEETQAKLLGEQVIESLAAKLNKLELLADHYKIGPGDNRLVILALRLAEDFVPGFAVQYPAHRKNAKVNPAVIAIGVHLAQQKDHDLTDFEACEVVAEILDESLKKPGNATRRRKRARTLQNLLPVGRRAISRNSAH